MDYLYASHANERIMQGGFHQHRLSKGVTPTEVKVNLVEHSNGRLVELMTSSADLSDFVHVLSTLSNSVISLLDRNNSEVSFFEAPFNLIINTGFNPAILGTTSSSCQEAIKLCPAVTKLDKALWLLISEYAAPIMVAGDDSKEEMVGMFFPFAISFKYSKRTN